MQFSSLSEILTGNLTLSGAYWFKTDSGPLTSLQCTLITGIKCSKLLYIVEKSAGQSPFLTSKHPTMSGFPLKFFIVCFTSLVGFWLSLLVHDVPRKDDVGIDLSRILDQFWYAH